MATQKRTPKKPYTAPAVAQVYTREQIAEWLARCARQDLAAAKRKAKRFTSPAKSHRYLAVGELSATFLFQLADRVTHGETIVIRKDPKK